jgi:hypothetical protein
MTRGPVPKRSDQRRRRNKPAVETTKVEATKPVAKPAASKGWHPIAKGWYSSLSDSAQSQFYEPSDWHSARFAAEIMSRVANGEQVSASEVSTMAKLMSELLVTEGARRRVRMEIERGQSAPSESKGVTALNEYRQRLGL